jgi:hypothetical protein
MELSITLFLTMMAGIGLGLLVSAGSKSFQMATYILILLAVFQFFFAGALLDLRGNRLEPLSSLSAARWSSVALGVTIDMPKITESTILCSDVPENPSDSNSALKTSCFHYPAAISDLRLPYEDDQLTRSWAVLIGMTILFLAITWLLLSRKTLDGAS